MILILFLLLTGGFCQPSRVPMNPNADFWSYCNETRPKNCTRTYSPVCATGLTGVPKTYMNSCHACNNLSMIAFRNGSCQTISFGCSDQNCSYSPEPIPACAFTPNEAYIMVESKVCCNVKPLPPYQMLITGNCPKTNMSTELTIPGMIKCREFSQNRFCPKQPNSKWVCGYNFDYVTKTTFSNGCKACNQPNIVGYTNGRCEGDSVQYQFVICPKNPPLPSPFPLPIPICTSDPVCAFPYRGLPEDFVGDCKVCPSYRFIGFKYGTCKSMIKTCQGKRIQCQILSSITPSCAFYRNSGPENINHFQCCLGKTYSHVMLGMCPKN